ncbi:FecR family protein [Reinekea forsetii]|nr:FecR family protein [Reinekea forsetii]
MMIKRLLIMGLSVLWAQLAIATTEPVGNAVVVIGSVTVKRDATGQSEALVAQGELFLNDVIVTGPDGLAKLLLRDDTTLKISPNSEVVISEMIAGPDAEGRSKVDLLKGRLRSVIGNKLGENTKFDIETPVAVAGVRGTDFEVVHIQVNGEWVTGVRCFDGSVEITSTGAGLASSAGVIILPAQYTSVKANALPTPATDINADQNLSEQLGASNADNTDDNLELDSILDSIEIQNITLDISTIENSLLERIVQSSVLESVVNTGGVTGAASAGASASVGSTSASVSVGDGGNASVQVGLPSTTLTTIIEDPQLDIITEPVEVPLPGVNLEFEVELPTVEVEVAL